MPAMIDSLMDSNILLRLPHRPDSLHQPMRAALKKIDSRGDRLYYISQNMSEFWNVCTRPATSRGGFGLYIAETDRRAPIIERYFTLLPDTADIHREWRRIVVAESVSGVAVHDARIVAAMRVHSVSHILTTNGADFARYAGITAIHPLDI